MRRDLLILSTLLAVAATVACSDPERTGARFCAELGEQAPLLAGPLGTPDEVDELVKRYRDLEKITPLAIEEEWTILTDLVEAASDVDPSDPRSQQDVADAAYKAERPARDIAIWVETTCGISMPDVVGVEGSVPVVTAPQVAPTTTVDPSATASETTGETTGATTTAGATSVAP